MPKANESNRGVNIARVARLQQKETQTKRIQFCQQKDRPTIK